MSRRPLTLYGGDVPDIRHQQSIGKELQAMQSDVDSRFSQGIQGGKLVKTSLVAGVEKEVLHGLGKTAEGGQIICQSVAGRVNVIDAGARKITLVSDVDMDVKVWVF